MAIISFTTTATQDAVAQRETAAYNKGARPDAQKTIPDYVTMRIYALLNEWVERYAVVDRITKADQYATASAADKATIDAILAKY